MVKPVKHIVFCRIVGNNNNWPTIDYSGVPNIFMSVGMLLFFVFICWCVQQNHQSILLMHIENYTCFSFRTNFTVRSTYLMDCQLLSASDVLNFNR